MVAWYVAGLVVLGSMVGTMAAVGLLGAWLFFILGDPGTCDKTSLFLGVNNLSDAGMALATLPLKLVSSLLTRAYNSWVPILLLAALALLVTYESGPARAATRRSRPALGRFFGILVLLVQSLVKFRMEHVQGADSTPERDFP